MKTARFTESQIALALRKADEGVARGGPFKDRTFREEIAWLATIGNALSDRQSMI